MELTGKDILIRKMFLEDANALLELRLRNRNFFQPWEPIRSDFHYTLESQTHIIEDALKDWEKQAAFQFGIFLKGSNQFIGRINFTGIVWGPWMNANLGYFMDQSENGKGYMTEAIALGLDYVFCTAGLHRVQAAVIPKNSGSIRVLEKSGFRYEGLAKQYLKINGQWEDHKIYAITQEDR